MERMVIEMIHGVNGDFNNVHGIFSYCDDIWSEWWLWQCMEQMVLVMMCWANGDYDDVWN